MRLKIVVSGELIAAGVSAVLMLVGAFGPWLKGPLGISVSGTDGSNDGWIMAGADVVAGVGVYAFAKFAHRGWAVTAVAGGLLGLGVGFNDWHNIRDLLKGAQFGGLQLVQVGWGLELGTIASGALMVAAVVLLIRGPQLAPQPPAPPPAAQSADPPTS